MLSQVPVIDVAPFAQRDLPTKRAIARVRNASNGFFDLPLAEKQQVLKPAPDIARGYTPLAAESVGRSQCFDVPGDLNESLMIGPVDAAADAYFTGPHAGKHFHPNSGRPARRICARPTKPLSAAWAPWPSS